jgi:guanine nucleotide-binding protein subunit alpha
MKIINLNGYSEDELFSWRATVYRNLVESAQTIIQAMKDRELSYVNKELNVKLLSVIIVAVGRTKCFFFFFFFFCILFNGGCEKMMAYMVSGKPRSQISPEIVCLIRELWQDPVVMECFEKREDGLYLMDSAP